MTANGEYSASDDDAGGYSKVTVNVESENNAKFISNNSSFSYTSCIQKISIPNGITKLTSGSLTMGGFTPSLIEVEIPASVTEINSSTFDHCENLEKITINKAEGSIEGAPWGATNAQVIWTG